MIGDSELTVCTKHQVDKEGRELQKRDNVSAKQLAVGGRRREIEDILDRRALENEFKL